MVSSISDTDFIINAGEAGTPVFNEESGSKNAFAFYQKRIMIIYRPELE